MSNLTLELDFSENIFNDAGNGDIEFDVHDYNPNFDIKISELTIVLLLEFLEALINNYQREFADEVHLNKKQRR
jgi:hypothetical protein